MIIKDQRLHPGRVAIFGSAQTWHILKEARMVGRTWYYGDHAYFKRFRYYRCTKNAFQYGKIDHNPNPQRFKDLQIDIKDWRTQGRHILLCPPDKAWSDLMDFNHELWLDRVFREIRLYTDRPIVVRDRHSKRGPLTDDLENCWALVTYMSNAAVDAAVAGIPVFCLGQCAGLLVGSGELAKLENPNLPDNRLQWAQTLANHQWDFSEITSGEAWRVLNATV